MQYICTKLYKNMKKILGMGNAIVDVLTRMNNDVLLEELNIPKGSMQLVEKDFIVANTPKLSSFEKHMAAGGSAANTISGLAKLGAETSFVGKVGGDEIGEFFKADIEKNNIFPQLQSSENLSGQCLVLISPDGERTMCTFLGAAAELKPEDLSIDMFKGYDFFHVEGYLVFNTELIKRAVQLAKEAGLKVSIDLASFNVVEAMLDFLKQLIVDYVDIVFANEEEAKSLTGIEAEAAVHEIAKICEIAVVKIGKDGSFIKENGKTDIVKGIEANCIDTTGAGDLYASGFLYGMAQELPLNTCGKIGSIVAGNVVEVVGAKMEEARWDAIKSEIAKLQ